MTPAPAQHSRNLFILFVLAELLIVVGALVMDGLTLEALHTTTRFSGRLSLQFFSMMLILRNRPEISPKYVSDKPYLLFAVIHGIHLVELLFYVQLSGNKLIPVRLLGGFMGYVFIFLLPYLTYLYDRGKLQAKTFRIAEMIYFPYLWFIFFMSYLPRVMKKLPNVGGSYWEHVTLFIWVILLGIIAVAYRRKVTAALQT